MKTIHLVSHTHWDREWYLTFQTFRLKLVHLIDHLIEILEIDPDYKYYMLDGQTIVLEDYLEIRPKKAAQLRKFIEAGRILIGPWYVLPDEFLVSPESTIRNLLRGKNIAETYGKRMEVGYIPDPFGHIGQMPQILKGFGIETACFRRGLADEPCELWWESPDGSKVLLSYMRDGYDNAANLSASSMQHFTDRIQQVIASIEPYSRTDQLLLMQGTDHMEPMNSTPQSIKYATNKLPAMDIVHSTLPNYFSDLKRVISKEKIDLPVFKGEARKSKRHELLPGVLSSRIWIKQRNHYCETQLEKWCEPFVAISRMIRRNPGIIIPHEYIENSEQCLEKAWKLLMQNHPHDSICGCSIDQVHKEMRTRFDQVEQIVESVSKQQLDFLASNIDTSKEKAESAVIVFNPTQFLSNDTVSLDFEVAAGWDSIELHDETNDFIPFKLNILKGQTLAEMSLGFEEFQTMLNSVQDGKVSGLNIVDYGISVNDKKARIEIILSNNHAAETNFIEEAIKKTHRIIDQGNVQTFEIIAREPITARIEFIAKGVPGIGYKTYYLRKGTKKYEIKTKSTDETHIENEYFKVEVDKNDGRLTIHEKGTSRIIKGLNQFSDSGDRGDEYNFDPLKNDLLLAPSLLKISKESDVLSEQLRLDFRIEIPESIDPAREKRSSVTLASTITSFIKLSRGVKRIDVSTEIANHSKDHRIRVHFPTDIKADSFFTDGHFDVVKRRIEIPIGGSDWAEQPYPEVPQRLFSDVTDGKKGLMIAVKGLPEVQVRNREDGMAELVVTLLRCIGWLSRDDLSLRPRAAGPIIETPHAQEIGIYTFEYSIIPHLGNWQIALPEVSSFNCGLKGRFTSIHKGILPSQLRMIDQASNDFLISTMKTSEKGNGIILRGVNLTENNILASTEINGFTINQAIAIKLDEDKKIMGFTISNNSFKRQVKPHQIQSTFLE